jgi:urease accessory protein
MMTMMMTTAIPMPPPDALLRLLVWLSPAFPTGGFAYSHGIEWAVEAGDISDGATLAGWLGDILRMGSARNDAILLRHAWAAQDLATLITIAELAAATAASRERQEETLSQGTAFCLAAQIWPSDLLRDLHGAIGRVAYPVGVGVLARAHAIPEATICQAYLQAFTANLVSAGVRLIPLGQTAGLRVQAALEPDILAAAEATEGSSLDDLGGACWRADIAAMRHETQYTRLFRS